MKIDEATPSTFGAMMEWIQSHYGYANILMGVFIALWLKLFFKKYPCNFYEIIIMLCFVIGMGMLIFTVFALIQGLLNVEVMQYAGIAGFVYMTWAIGQFFDKNKKLNYLKAFFAYILGSLTFIVVLAIIGFVVEIVK